MAMSWQQPQAICGVAHHSLYAMFRQLLQGAFLSGFGPSGLHKCLSYSSHHKSIVLPWEVASSQDLQDYIGGHQNN